MPDEPTQTVAPALSAPPTPPATPPAKGLERDGTAQGDPYQIYEFPGIDGSPRRMTVAEMVEAVNRQGPNIDPERLAKLDLYESAAKGDPEATRKLVETYLPKVPETPPDPAKVIATLQQEVQELKQVVSGRLIPTHDQIETLRYRSLMANVIDQTKNEVPYTAKNPKGPDMVLAMFRQQVAAFRIPENDPRMRSVLANCMTQVENELRSTATLYQGFNPQSAPPANGSPAQKVVDDQAARRPVNHIPARLAMIGERIVDERGRPVVQGPDQQFYEVPNTVPNNLPPGAPVSAAADNRPKGPMTRAAMDEYNRQRIAAMQGGNP